MKRTGEQKKEFSKRRLTHKLGSYWKYVSNRRKFFTDIAAQQGFDALRASNWYNLKAEVILQAKVNHLISTHLNSSQLISTHLISSHLIF
jgi:hypothetical protein